MAQFVEFSLDSTAGAKLYGIRSIPDSPVRAVVQIAHGIGDHIDRYRPFMARLAEQGYLAVGCDHLGHGRNITCKEDTGVFNEQEGWRHVVRDLARLHDQTAADFPGVPYILFGHSMGSFLMRTYLAYYPEKYDMAILSGTGHPDHGIVRWGARFARTFVRLAGYHANGSLLEKLCLGSCNKAIPSPRTPFDWISSDQEQVDLYIADPMCGFTAKAGVYSDMMQGILYITDPNTIAKTCPDKPMLFISGSEDPVGEYGKGVTKAYESYASAGVKDIGIRLYPGGRHEMLNEVCKEQVIADILEWIGARVGNEETE